MYDIDYVKSKWQRKTKKTVVKICTGRIPLDDLAIAIIEYSNTMK